PLPAPGAREGDGQKALAGLDATTVGVATIGVCGCVAPVALDLPALAADGHEPVEGPRALVCVLGALLVIPSVELRVGQHLAELMPADVRKGRKALAMAEVSGGPRIAARIAVEVEEEAELHLNTVDRARAVPRAVARVAPRLVRVDRVVGTRLRMAARHLGDLLQNLPRRGRPRRCRRGIGGVAGLRD